MGAKLSASSQGGANPYPANSEMNVTPFVDVMLVLLIIFMVAAPLSTVTVPVELPPATTKPADKEKPAEPVFVSVEKDGEIYVMEEKITLSMLPAKLNEKTNGDFNERIYIRADQTLAYKIVVQVMSVMQDAGFYKIGIVAEEIEE